MFQSAVSWMVAPVMLTKSLGQTLERRGNTHQFFAPVSVYPTRDGFIYLAVGNEKQWENIVATREFAALARAEYRRNAGRIAAVKALEREMHKVLGAKTAQEWIEFFNALGVPASRVNTLRDVVADELVRGKMITARDEQAGVTIHLPAPVVVTDFLREQKLELKFPPRLGEDNERILGALGYDVAELKAKGVV